VSSSRLFVPIVVLFSVLVAGVMWQPPPDSWQGIRDAAMPILLGLFGFLCVAFGRLSAPSLERQISDTVRKVSDLVSECVVRVREPDPVLAPSAVVKEPEYGYSLDGETYYGRYPSPEFAALEGFAACEQNDNRLVHVSRLVDPKPLEDYFDAVDLLERAGCSDDYSGDHAEGWDRSTAEQRADLDRVVRRLIGEWVDQNNLRPHFFTIADDRQYLLIDGKPLCVNTVV
jgi:hypothetical protein